jgi:hypothetical protein
MKNPILLLFASVLLYSCASTEYVHISVMEPAPVSLPPSIKNIGVVNRSQASKETKVIDAIDKVFSLEGANLDKDGASATIGGLTDELMKNNRFTEVKPLTNLELKSVGAGIFPSPMAWDAVEKICKENHVDALFALELFDTDSKIGYAASPVSLTTPLGHVPAIEQQANITTQIKTGWRIYDPVGRNILDEYPLTRSVSRSASGINPLVAANVIVGRKEAVKEVGTRIGQIYADRIIPFWIRVTRDYYVRGTDNFRIARRKAQTGNWNEAGSLWQQETTSPDSKVAGRACYNMAIISEINGDLDSAIDWAQKGYENYGNRLSLTYVNILKNRKAAMLLVQDQNQSGGQ